MNNKKYSNKPIYYIASALQEVKKYDKLIGSFIDKLSEDASKHNGRIFTNFNQVGTNTLRMSSSNPKQDWAYVAWVIYVSFLIRFRQVLGGVPLWYNQENPLTIIQG